MSGDLDQALERVSLIDVLAAHCATPELRRLDPRRGGRIRSPLPGDDDHDPSFSVYPAPGGGRLLWKRHGTTKGGNAYHLLVELGFSPSDAASELARMAGLEAGRGISPSPRRERPRAPTPLERARAKAERYREVDVDGAARATWDRARERLERAWPVADLVRRGFTRAAATGAGLGVRGDGALVIPVFGPALEVLAIKVRLPDPLPDGGQRYVYQGCGHGTPAWCSIGYGAASAVLLVEGELNAIAASAALTARGADVDVQGLAGSSGDPHLAGLAGREVLVYADGDAAGAEARARWMAIAREAGATRVAALRPLQDARDFCDVAGGGGLARLGALIESMLARAGGFQARPDFRPQPGPKNNALGTGSIISGQRARGTSAALFDGAALSAWRWRQ